MRLYRDGWFKVSRRLTGSSLWHADPVAIKVWVWLLEASQRPDAVPKGTVYVSRQMLAAYNFLTLEQLDAALAVLSEPDPQSRTMDHEGRRIEILPNGFRLLNHWIYHDKRATEATSQARREAGRKGGVATSLKRETAKAPLNQQLPIQQTASKPVANGQQTETETTVLTGEDDPSPSDPLNGKAEKSSQSRARGDHGTAAERQALDRCAFHLGRKLGYSKANVGAIKRAKAHYTGQQVVAVLQSIRHASTPTGRWCHERLSSGLPLAYMLRPGEKGAADRILEQLGNSDKPGTGDSRLDGLREGTEAYLRDVGALPPEEQP